MKISESLKSFDLEPVNIFPLLVASVLLSLPTIILGNNIVYALPVLLTIIFSLIYGERFIIAIILITLFTLVGEFNPSLRSVIHLVDFTLLGIFFLKRFGLNFSSYPRIPKSLTCFLALYGTVFLLSAAMSKYPFAGVGLITQQVAFFIIAYVFYSLLNTQNDVKYYFIGIYIVAGIIVTFSLIAFFSEGLNLLEVVSPNRPRVSVFTGNIETSTNFFVVSFPLIISSLLLKKNFLEKRIEYFTLFYFSLGLILMMSRSAIIGILFSSALIFYMLRRKRFYKLILSLAVLVLLFLFYQPLNDLSTTFLRIESGMSARDYLWQMSMDMIKENTVFGIGPGAYQYEMLNYFPYMLDNWWGKFVIHLSEVSGGANLSHNYFLTFFTDMGILGLLTAIALPVVYFRIGIKTIMKFKAGTVGNYYLIIGLFAAGSSIILRNFFNGIGLLYVGGLQTDLPFWLIFGSLIYFYRLPLLTENNSKVNN